MAGVVLFEPPLTGTWPGCDGRVTEVAHVIDPDRLRRLALPLVGFAAVVLILRFATPHSLRGSGSAQASPSPSASAPPRPSPTPTQSDGVPAARSASGYVCPSWAPIAAYGFPRGSHYFPPGHPRHPDPAVAPDGCYRTGREAEADGFTLGLPPQGWQEVDGAFLAPDWVIGMDLSSVCQRAADSAGFPVPCPHMIPVPMKASGGPGCGTAFPANPACIYRATEGRAFYFQLSSVLDEGHPAGGAGLTIAAFPAAGATAGSKLQLLFLCGGKPTFLSGSLFFPFSYEPTAFRTRSTDCAQGVPPSGGQRLLRWKRGGIIYVIGLPLDFANEHPGLLVQIAEGIQFVPPSR